LHLTWIREFAVESKRVGISFWFGNNLGTGKCCFEMCRTSEGINILFSGIYGMGGKPIYLLIFIFFHSRGEYNVEQIRLK